MKFSYSNKDFHFDVYQQGVFLNIEFVDTDEDVSIKQSLRLKKEFLRDDTVKYQMFTYTFGDYSLGVIQYGVDIVVNINKRDEPIVQSTLMLSASDYFVGLLETQVPEDKQEEALEKVRSVLEEHSFVPDSNGS